MLDQGDLAQGQEPLRRTFHVRHPAMVSQYGAHASIEALCVEALCSVLAVAAVVRCQTPSELVSGSMRSKC